MANYHDQILTPASTVTANQDKTAIKPGEMYETQAKWIACGMCSVYFKLALRLLQIIAGVTIFGVYCADLVAASAHGATPSSAWLFACVTGAFGGMTALIYLLPCVHSYLFFWWDWIIVVLHTGLVGIFAKAYITQKAPLKNPSDFKIMGPNFDRERSVAYIDCISGGLWMTTAVMSSIIYFKLRRLRSMDGF